MATLKVYNKENSPVGEITVSDDVFATEVKSHLLHAVVRWQLARRQAGTHKAKGRAEVAYSTKKLYRQKGTGNARRGSRRSPILRGGGVIFGPTPRSHAFKLNRKTRKAALCCALSAHVDRGTFKVLDELQLDEIKTKKLAGTLGTLEMGGSVLIIGMGDNRNLMMSARNLHKSKFIAPEGLNVYDLMNHERVLITKQAIEAVEGALTK
jgi:large subunit ribosomal protein L4